MRIEAKAPDHLCVGDFGGFPGLGAQALSLFCDRGKLSGEIAEFGIGVRRRACD
jgi:hypothetical protein